MKSLITGKVEMIAISLSEITLELRVGTEIYFTYRGEARRGVMMHFSDNLRLHFQITTILQFRF